MLDRIQLYIYVVLAMGLMLTALLLSMDGDVFGSVLMAIASVAMFLLAIVNERMLDE